MQWKRARSRDRCPHCQSRQLIVAIQTPKGCVLACKQCCGLGLYEYPGFEGRLTVEDVQGAQRLTEEGLQFFGKLGFQFQIAQAKHRTAERESPQAGKTQNDKCRGQKRNLAGV